MRINPNHKSTDINKIYETQENISSIPSSGVQQDTRELQPKDKSTISPKARALLSSMNQLERKDPPSQSDDQLTIFDIMEQIRNQAESGDDPMKELYKCLVIAMRIMAGHQVPLKDEQFLAEKQPEMYLRAVLLRRENNEAEKYESLLKDEKRNPFDD